MGNDQPSHASTFNFTKFSHISRRRCAKCRLRIETSPNFNPILPTSFTESHALFFAGSLFERRSLAFFHFRRWLTNLPVNFFRVAALPRRQRCEALSLNLDFSLSGRHSSSF